LTLGALEKWGKMKQIMILFGEIEKAPSPSGKSWLRHCTGCTRSGQIYVAFIAHRLQIILFSSDKSEPGKVEPKYG